MKAFTPLLPLLAIGLGGCKGGGDVADAKDFTDNVSTPTDKMPLGYVSGGSASLQGDGQTFDGLRRSDEGRNNNTTLQMPPRVSAPPFPSPQAPENRKADVSVVGRYTTKTSSAEIVAVCRMNENSLECWKADGSASPEMASKIQKVLKEGMSQGMDVPFPTYFGKLNRMVVVKLVNLRAQSQRANSQLSLVSAGKTPRRANYSPNIQLYEDEAGSTTWVRSETPIVAEEPGAKTTIVRLNHIEPLTDRPVFECRVGASGTFDGSTYTVTSIKSSPPSAFFGTMPGSRPIAQWTVTFKRESSSNREPTLNIAPVDAAEKLVRFTDEKGMPVAESALKKGMDKSNLRPIYSRFIGRVNNVYSFVVSFDPFQTEKFVLHGGFSRHIEIKDIPLEPR